MKYQNEKKRWKTYVVNGGRWETSQKMKWRRKRIYDTHCPLFNILAQEFPTMFVFLSLSDGIIMMSSLLLYNSLSTLFFW